ncbi:MAG TPA: TonB-dependent receptor [Rhizomicrobium sp.]|jgi:iron complex outermembrane receptor protein|nr:TonB-dependent receptor [Rhizomicrobium sp.]
MNNLVQKLMLGCSASAMVTLLVHSAQAQQPSENVESVTVSGSRITIGGFQAPTPVTVVDTEKLEQNAYANITDDVRQLPQVNSPPASFGFSQGAASPGTAGANLLNLRNLGINRTLVLFDGQRIVNSNLTGGVDVTTLPQAVVQRVDVVTGGASAAWGSDAVAGVVNFILDKNFVGFKGKVQGGSTTDSMIRSLSAQAMWGQNFANDRGHIELAAEYNNRPDTALLIEQKWYRGTYLVSNPSFTAATASNSNPQFVPADHVGLAVGTIGGLVTSSPAANSFITGITTGSSSTNTPAQNLASNTAYLQSLGFTNVATNPGAANLFRGIRFVQGGQVQQVNFGNITSGALSNGGSLTDRDSEAPWQTLGNPNKTYSLFMHSSYKITDTITASLQMNYGYFTGQGDAQSNMNNALLIKADNAFLPAAISQAMVTAGVPVLSMGTLNANNFNNNTVTRDNYTQQAAGALAPATTYNRRQLMRGVFTLDGSLGSDWLWNTYFSHSQTRFSVRTNGVPVLANMQAAQDAVLVTTANRGNSGFALGSIVCRSSLPGQPPFVVGKVTAAPGCVPLNPIGEGVASAAGIRYATGNNQDFENMTLTMDVFEASMQGKLPWSLGAGDITMAFGFHYRKEAGKNVATVTGDQGGYAVANYANFPSSNINVREGFAEINVPILKDTFVDSLDFNAAGRATDYSTSGGVQTWKLGFTSQLNEDIKLRSVWSVDIRAPTVQDLFAPANVNTGSTTDPKTGLPVSIINNVLGNPTLRPEVARTISGGIVLTPHWIPGFTFSLDWYNLNLTGQIATLAQNFILSTCTANINDPVCSALVFSGPGGSLSIINRVPININALRTSGMDIAASYATELWDGTLSTSFNATYVDELTIISPTSVPGVVDVNDYAGVMGAGAPAQTSGSSKWKGVLSANYKTGPYSFTTQVRWYGSAILNNFWNTGNRAAAAARWTVSDEVFNIDPTAYLDLRASYDLNPEIQFFAAVDNLLDIPPQMKPGTSDGIQSNGGPTHSVTQYDLLGREIRLGIRFNF